MPEAKSAGPAAPVRVKSNVTVISVDGKQKRVVHSADRLIEAPNWSVDGKYLVVNADGKLWKLPVEGGQLQMIPMGRVEAINNDHGISADGNMLAISERGGPIYVMPIDGGEPRAVTPQRPSFFHGWSPDGKDVAYVARSEKFYDVYASRIDGGSVRRLTMGAGNDDGPDYSPDGKWIYFNSGRFGGGTILRIPRDGGGENDALAQRVTFEDWVDWFPHPSPDSKWLVLLSYQPGTEGHPANKDVVLRIMPLPGDRVDDKARPRELVKLFGGQGTINVASWSPDSRWVAYVAYELI